MAAGQAQVAAVAAGAVARQVAQAVAQETSRGAGLQALNHWMPDFLAIVRIALADQPQRLTQLGAIGA